MAKDHSKIGFRTRLSHTGRPDKTQHGFVNPPLLRGSTVLTPTIAERKRLAGMRGQRVLTYGLGGSTTHWALQDVIAEVEGGTHCAIVCSGLAAVSTPLLAFLKANDHCLMPDSVYGPARNFAEGMLTRFGVDTTFYDPLIGGEGIAALMRPNTRAVFCESPGSLTFEVQDVPAIARAAHAHGAAVLMDNTWGTPLHFNALGHGVDLSVQAVTKYVGGHADVMMGYVCANERHAKRLSETHAALGLHAGSDDCFLALRGLRTLPVRLARHMATALKLARWLKARPEVLRVLHPALADDPGHALWARDFTGACGLFGLELKPVAPEAVAAFMNGMHHFGLGYSWGGFESLIIPAHIVRTAKPFVHEGPMLRIHAGLEDADDLIADLEAGFERMKAAG
jgi:cysteine-S-conjugate beta-lyase